MVILGIDPGTATTGFGIVKKGRRGNIKCLGFGCIITKPGLLAGDRLRIINRELARLIKRYKPKAVAVENVFFFKNLKTAFPVAQAKGVILLTAAQYNVPVKEFTPLQIKMALTSYGKADKRQVQRMIATMLKLKTVPKPDDAADALAAALCCAYSLKKV